MEDLSGEQRLVLAVMEVRGPAHAVIAILSEAKRAEPPEEFGPAYFRAIRSLDVPRTANAELREQIKSDRAALAEIRPFLKAAYEGKAPTKAEISRARRMTENRLADLVAA